MKTLIKNAIIYVGENLDRFDNTDILFENGIISAIGCNLFAEDTECIDGSEFFITPGFVNAHFHPSQQINRALGVGYSHDKQMDLLHATGSIKEPKDTYWMSCLAVLEGLKAGTTCFYSVGSYIETWLEVFNAMGVRAACAIIPKDIIAEEKDQSVRAQAWATEERLLKAEDLFRSFIMN